jgi:hypothetical protein
MVAFTVWMAGSGLSSPNRPDMRAFWVFAIALAFTTLLPYLPRRESKKWIIEDVRRTMATGVAISGITSAIWNRKLRPEQRNVLFGGLLSAIKSEVEGITGDNEGIYLNVSLLLLDDGGGNLAVVSRANNDRPLSSYRKADLMISQALLNGEKCYEPDCKLADKPYKAVLGLPLVSTPECSKPLVHGVVSIDSSKAHCFDGLLDDIEAKTLVYVNLLKLVIVSDESLSSVRGRQNVRKH